jgi:hypothetical protein
VCSGFGVVDCDLSETFDGRLIVDGPVGMKDTAVTMGGVFAETDVGGDVDRGEGFAEDFDRLDYGSVRVVGEGALLILSEQREERVSTMVVEEKSMM